MRVLIQAAPAGLERGCSRGGMLAGGVPHPSSATAWEHLATNLLVCSQRPKIIACITRNKQALAEKLDAQSQGPHLARTHFSRL